MIYKKKYEFSINIDDDDDDDDGGGGAVNFI